MHKANSLLGKATSPVTILVLCAVMLSFMAPMASAYDEPETTWTQTGTGFGGVYPGVNAYKSATVGYYGAPWIPGRNVWEYNFRIASPGETRWSEDGSAIDTISTQRLVISETVNKDHQAMWTSTDSRYLGAWPESGPNPSVYLDAAFSATSLAVGAINAYAGFALGVVDLLIALVHTCDNQQDGETILREWWFAPAESDAFHWFWWLHDVDPNQQVKFTVSDEMYGQGWEYVGVGWEFTCTTPSPPGSMSVEEREQYGIEEIPISKLTSRASDLNIAPETVEELQKIGQPIYYAHKLPLITVEIKTQPDTSLVSPEFLAAYSELK